MFDLEFIILISVACVCFGFLSGYILRGFFRSHLTSESNVQPGNSLQDGKLSFPNQHHRNQLSDLGKEQPSSEETLEISAQSEKNYSTKIDLSPVNILTQAIRSDIKQSVLPEQSMISQVDEILQKKLHLAGLKRWAIRLTEFPQRGMVVMVGLEQYNGIDEVPYEKVRSIIRESVSEWEQRANM